LLIPYVVRN